ncbi:response regulator [Pseudorhodoferax sp.]|uniref:response regulator n=1 Tax=Pseudorhodoferax sp. TaxID=1993553 RepID=UPI002DD6B0BC|nr:response regulator [Pseudorhodoferax sp.]
MALLREWLLLAGVLAVLAGLMVYALLREHRRIEAAESARLQTQAQVVDHHVRRQLESVDQALRTMLQTAAQWPQPVGPAGEAALHTLAEVMPGVRTLTVMDGRGTVLASNRPELLGRNYSDRDFFRQALASQQPGMLYLSAPFRSYLGSVALNVARVSVAPSGGVARLANATLDPDYFGGVLGSVTYAPDMWAGVLHGQAGQLFQVAPLTAADQLEGLGSAGSFWQQHAASGAQHSLVGDPGGEQRRLVAVRTVLSPRLQVDHPLAVVVGRSEAAMYAPIWQQARTYGLLFAAAALACVLGLGLLQRRRIQVTALQQASRSARRESEERVALALRGADLGLWEWDLDSGRMVLDARGCSMLGLTPAQLQLERQPWAERIHPDDVAAVLAHAADHAQGRAPRFEAEFRVRHADRHWVWILSRGNRIDGTPARLAGTHMDSTARKQAAESLAAREAELRDFKNMLDETLDCVFILDARTLQFIYVNEGAIRLSGYSEAELLEMKPTDLLWDTTPAQYMERTRALVEGREPSQLVEVVHRHRDGHPIPVEVFLQYLPATAERRPRFLAVVRDITARHAETALKLSEARFRLLIERAPTAIAILRGDRFDYTNPRFLAMHGYGASDSLAGTPWRAAFAVDAHAALVAAQAAPEAGKAHSVCKSGQLLPVLVASTSVELSDGLATVVFLQDISALELAEAELVQARDTAEQASRAKATFVANMSHEVRTPLNAILGLAYLLEHSALTGEPLDLVRKIHSAGRTLLGIINHVLDISKIEAGRLEIEHAPFRLDEVIDNVATIMGVNAGDKALELVITPAPLGAGHLIGDALRLQQVLVNLTGNAIKFTDKGQVALQTQLLHRDSRQVQLRFAIVDTGIGIAPDKVGDIFSPFAQADSSTTRRFGGTGLGLAICRQLVELMGGEIGVRSTPGQGSEFWFTVPFAPAPPAHFSSPAMLQVRALMADDSALAREAAVATARALGWQMDAVASGRAALEFIGQHTEAQSLPDVVLLDWRMPGMDGLAAARAIRASVPPHACPIVIMVTAHARGQLLQEAGEDLLDAVLDKPLTSSKLYDAVVQAQRRRGTAAHSPAPAEPAAEQPLAGLSILVVDDSEINREVAQRILQRQGAAVQLAGDGQQALDLLGNDDGAMPDIVLMDVQMPVMDGIEATRRIRQQPQLARLPVVALTAGAFRSQQDAAWAAGMNGFIGKPFDVGHAVALIRRLTGRDGAQETRAPAPAQAAPARPADVPGVDLAQGLQIWADAEAYHRFLGRFAREHADSAEHIGTLLADGERERAAGLVHRLRGAAAHLALPDTAAAAAEIERLLLAGEDPAAALQHLREALATASASIAALRPAAAVAPTAGNASGWRPDPGQRTLLQSLLAALDRDDPGPAEPMLAALASQLPAGATQTLQTLQGLLDDYDFRGAEQQVRQLLDTE